MSQLKHVVDPFGEVNVYPSAGGRVRVVATILMEPHKEGAQTFCATGVTSLTVCFFCPNSAAKKPPVSSPTP